MADRIHKITFRVEKTTTGFSAFATNHPVYTIGTSFARLTDHAMEACNLYFEEEGRKIKASDIRFEIDFQQFFRYYRVLNAKFLAEKIGMNPSLLSQYVKGRKKPSAKQSERILQGIQQIGKELSDIGMIHPS